MTVWVLIVIVHGWGAGVGSTGNAITTQEFSSRERCVAAVKYIRHASESSQPWTTTAYCLPK